MFKTSGENNFLGLSKKFLKNLSWEKKNFVETGAKILKKKIMIFFYNKLYFLMSNVNLECFQLSFDVHIVYVGQKL